MIITIDGPAGSGKSTAARRLALVLGIAYLDTGATYRAVTLRGMQNDVPLHDEQALTECARAMRLQMTPCPDGLIVEMDGQDVSKAIRTETVSRQVRHAANAPAVREVLVALQRTLGQSLGSFVTEGRDQGSAVFPDADFKFYLDADPAQRAQRRFVELTARGEAAELTDILEAILARDASDTGREVGPLQVPDDAIVIDTTKLSIDDVVETIQRHVEAA